MSGYQYSRSIEDSCNKAKCMSYGMAWKELAMDIVQKRRGGGGRGAR